MSQLRILLADGHAMVREGLKLVVNQQPDMVVIAEAADGREAVEQALSQKPDVVVMDLSIPELRCEQATHLITSQDPQIKVLTLSVHAENSYLNELMEAGASGCVLKQAVADELIQAIRTVASGNVYVDPSLAETVVANFLEMHQRSGVRSNGGLSEREGEVIRLIARGFSNKEVASQLEIGIKTVETYKSRALEKIGIHSRADLVQYALHHGWLRTD